LITVKAALSCQTVFGHADACTNKYMSSRLALERRFVFDASTQLGFRSAAVPEYLLATIDVILLFVDPHRGQ
jgi:hypothetical protein